jgi:hypothetical protein
VRGRRKAGDIIRGGVRTPMIDIQFDQFDSIEIIVHYGTSTYITSAGDLPLSQCHGHHISHHDQPIISCFSNIIIFIKRQQKYYDKMKIKSSAAVSLLVS